MQWLLHERGLVLVQYWLLQWVLYQCVSLIIKEAVIAIIVPLNKCRSGLVFIDEVRIILLKKCRGLHLLVRGVIGLCKGVVVVTRLKAKPTPVPNPHELWIGLLVPNGNVGVSQLSSCSSIYCHWFPIVNTRWLVSVFLGTGVVFFTSRVIILSPNHQKH